MKLYSKQNALSDSAALRTAALALTYYNSTNHPEKSSVEWASTLANITRSLTPSSGIIKTSIEEVIDLVETNISVTVDNHMAYCQYYSKSAVVTTEDGIQYTGLNNENPGIHYDYETGFDPVYYPDCVAMVYIGPNTGTIEFWEHDGRLDTPNSLIIEETLTTNDLLIFNHSFAHRMAPVSWGNTQSDSGLHLVLFMKTS